MEPLLRLFAQQQSPIEVLVFLMLIIIVFMLVAGVLYTAFMLLLRPFIPTPLTLRQILFPSSAQLRENLAQYLLIATTSLLLSLTLIVKNDLVEQISRFKLSPAHLETLDPVLDSVLTFGASPELKKDIANLPLSEVVKPLIKSGDTENADLIVRSAIEYIEPQHWLKARHLLIACLTLALIYLIWLAKDRYFALREKPTSAPDYSKTYKGLLTLAFCVGLLLASTIPLAQESADMLARSTVSTIAHAVRRSQNVPPNALSLELQQQQAHARFLYCPECEVPSDNVWKTLEISTGDTTDFLQRLRTDVDAEINTIEQRLTTIQRNLAQEMRNEFASLNASQKEAYDARLYALDQVIADASALKQEVSSTSARLTRHIGQQSIEQGSEHDELQNVINRLEGSVRTVDRELELAVARLNSSIQQRADSDHRHTTVERRVRTLENTMPNKAEKSHNHSAGQVPIQ